MRAVLVVADSLRPGAAAAVARIQRMGIRVALLTGDSEQTAQAVAARLRITPEHVREALLAGMAEQRAEVAAVVADPAEPTFENTVVALERSGQLLARAVFIPSPPAGAA